MKILAADERVIRLRFFSKTQRQAEEVKPGLGPCLLWTGALRNGYGHFRLPREAQPDYAHRIAFYLVHRRAPRRGLEVRHRCDVRACVEATHLVEGTRLENVTDAVAQGRHAHGEQHALSKLTHEQVVEIRAAFDALPRGTRRTGSVRGRAIEEMARRHGVSFEAVHSVVYRASWRHVS